MSEKLTKDLSEVLEKTHISEFDKYCTENKKSMNVHKSAFSVYVKELLNQKGITQQIVFLKADIPERYGYKLLSGEKRTRQRDVILRICYAAEFTIDETQRVLEKYEMPKLYPKIPRDAFLTIIFNERPGSIIDINSLLKEKGFEPLRTSGVQE
jgi:hypothetical protein